MENTTGATIIIFIGIPFVIGLWMGYVFGRMS